MEPAILSETSAPYVGQWRRLVSTTNWEKGRIIFQWREALRAADAAASECSDEAWSRQVGGAVSPQHVGRLRRVFDRFGQVHASYEGLYWSHFQAALDWDDAEMWLEGALQNRWPVGQMRDRRGEVLGAVVQDSEPDQEIEVDEDSEETDAAPDDHVLAEIDDVRAAQEPSDDVDDDYADETSAPESELHESDSAARRTDPAAARTYLSRLSDDFVEALETLKACLLRHKMAGWHELSQSDALAALDDLRTLAASD